MWASNVYTNDGVNAFRVTCSNAPAKPNAACPDPTVINGFNGRDIPRALQDAVMTNAGNGNVDALDRNFKIPSVWKIGAGADYLLDIPGLGDSGKNIELKTNYLGTAREGRIAVVAANAHAGRTTQVWDATVRAEATGKTIALFRCTQSVLWPK